MTIPLVAYPPMNDVHHEEVALITTLLTHVQSHDIDAIDTSLEGLLAHTRDHFANEERLMREVGFPPYMMHLGEHTRFLHEFQYIVLQWRSDRDIERLHEYLSSTLPMWLENHIATMDTITAQFIAMRLG